MLLMNWGDSTKVGKKRRRTQWKAVLDYWEGDLLAVSVTWWKVSGAVEANGKSSGDCQGKLIDRT